MHANNSYFFQTNSKMSGNQPPPPPPYPPGPGKKGEKFKNSDTGVGFYHNSPTPAVSSEILKNSNNMNSISKENELIDLTLLDISASQLATKMAIVIWLITTCCIEL